jgi:hypothetical protein
VKALSTEVLILGEMLVYLDFSLGRAISFIYLSGSSSYYIHINNAGIRLRIWGTGTRQVACCPVNRKLGGIVVFHPHEGSIDTG